jgi:hypothetical protein
MMFSVFFGILHAQEIVETREGGLFVPVCSLGATSFVTSDGIFCIQSDTRSVLRSGSRDSFLKESDLGGLKLPTDQRLYAGGNGMIFFAVQNTASSHPVTRTPISNLMVLDIASGKLKTLVASGGMFGTFRSSGAILGVMYQGGSLVVSMMDDKNTFRFLLSRDGGVVWKDLILPGTLLRYNPQAAFSGGYLYLIAFRPSDCSGACAFSAYSVSATDGKVKLIKKATSDIFPVSVRAIQTGVVLDYFIHGGNSLDIQYGFWGHGAEEKDEQVVIPNDAVSGGLTTKNHQAIVMDDGSAYVTADGMLTKFVGGKPAGMIKDRTEAPVTLTSLSSFGGRLIATADATYRVSRPRLDTFEYSATLGDRVVLKGFELLQKSGEEVIPVVDCGSGNVPAYAWDDDTGFLTSDLATAEKTNSCFVRYGSTINLSFTLNLVFPTTDQEGDQ